MFLSYRQRLRLSKVVKRQGEKRMTRLETFVQSFIKSLGLKRKLSQLFQVLSVVALTNPVLQPFAPYLQAIASWLGVAGVTQAVVQKSINKTNIIATIGAFLSALLLAAPTVPALLPFVGVIKIVAVIFGLITHTNLVASKKK